ALADISYPSGSKNGAQILWVHFANRDGVLSQESIASIYREVTRGLYVCTISCWEVAKLVEYGRLDLDMPVGTWLHRALSETGCDLLYLEPEIAALSTSLPGEFHKDPADQIIVATGMIKNLMIATNDHLIIDYPRASTLDCR
ncbi:MAG: type II toxin-antitoxin system VapC family toxin, partial [Rhodothermales bacterium]